MSTLRAWNPSIVRHQGVHHSLNFVQITRRSGTLNQDALFRAEAFKAFTRDSAAPFFHHLVSVWGEEYIAVYSAIYLISLQESLQVKDVNPCGLPFVKLS